MRVVFSERAVTALGQAPADVRRAFGKQLRFLELNLRHPSLRAKKYNEPRDIWQARVTRNWRFYFRIEGDVYRIDDLIAHPK